LRVGELALKKGESNFDNWLVRMLLVNDDLAAERLNCLERTQIAVQSSCRRTPIYRGSIVRNGTLGTGRDADTKKHRHRDSCRLAQATNGWFSM
jgi:hypothetical protein